MGINAVQKLINFLKLYNSKKLIVLFVVNLGTILMLLVVNYELKMKGLLENNDANTVWIQN